MINEYNKVDVALGIIISNKRKERNVSQTQLGKAIGLSKQSVCSYEKGRRSMNASDFFKICEYLFLEPNEVSRRVREMVQNEQV